MNFISQTEGRTGTIKLEGRFTFEAHQEFKGATTPFLNPNISSLQLDLSAVSYMDSSSLGMLLLLREKAEAKGIKVVLLKPSPSVMAIIKVVQFGKLFEIIE